MSYVEDRLENMLQRRATTHGRDEIVDVLAIALAEIRVLEGYRTRASPLMGGPQQPVAPDAETAALSLQDRVRELEADAVQIRRDHAAATLRLTREVRELAEGYVVARANVGAFSLKGHELARRITQLESDQWRARRTDPVEPKNV
jgi:hypothetical protein